MHSCRRIIVSVREPSRVVLNVEQFCFIFDVFRKSARLMPFRIFLSLCVGSNQHKSPSIGLFFFHFYGRTLSRTGASGTFEKSKNELLMVNKEFLTNLKPACNLLAGMSGTYLLLIMCHPFRNGGGLQVTHGLCGLLKLGDLRMQIYVIGVANLCNGFLVENLCCCCL